MPKTEFDQILKLEPQICFPFYAASRLISQAHAPALKKLGITYGQYLVLIVLWEHDGQTVKEIGKKLYLDSGTLTPLLAKMEELKLITRVRNKEDDRQVLNFLMPRAIELKIPTGKLLKRLMAVLNISESDELAVRNSTNVVVHRLTELLTEKPRLEF